MSEMDGVCEIAEYVNQAFAWGHNAIAITDHMAVQAFPKAQAAVSKILKKNPDAKTNYEEAKEAAKGLDTDMKIVPVKNVQEAIDYLRSTN